MKAQIHSSGIKGTIAAPPSKSVMQRVCAAALLRNGETRIYRYGQSEDDKAALRIITQLGASVTDMGRFLKVTSSGMINVVAGTVLDCGESGLSLRMFTPLAALSAEEITITVNGSLANRPSPFFQEILPQLGVTVSAGDPAYPIRIKGPMKPRNITVDGSLTSQFLTGLLFAYSAAKGTDVAIETLSLKSKPYIDLTLKVMEDFKMDLPVHQDYRSFRFGKRKESKPDQQPLNYTIEGDWSNAAFMLVAGAIAGNVTVKDLDVFTTQADKKILEALQDCGCRLSIQAEQIEVSHQPLKAFHFDATDCPDLFPPLAVLAACCSGTSVIEGVHRLTYKESDRATALCRELGKLGVIIDIQDDKMIIKGGGAIQPAIVDSHHDHRMAMACAVLALKAGGTVIIDHAKAVNKSYPGFFSDLSQLCTEQHAVHYS